MRKKMLLFHLGYYLLCLLVYVGFLLVSVKLFRTSNLGAAIAITYGLMFLATPVLIAVMMRLSLLRWYVDPFAAAQVPLFLYAGMIFNEMHRKEVELAVAFAQVNKSLSTDAGSGWFFLGGLFVFGLAASFSLARKNGQSISYRLIARIGNIPTT